MASGHRKWCYYYSTTPAMGLAIPPISRPGGFTGGFTGIDWIGLYPCQPVFRLATDLYAYGDLWA